MSTNLANDLTIAFVAIVLAGVAIAASSWDSAAHVIQLGLVLAIVVIVIGNSSQITGFTSMLTSSLKGK